MLPGGAIFQREIKVSWKCDLCVASRGQLSVRSVFYPSRFQSSQTWSTKVVSCCVGCFFSKLEHESVEHVPLCPWLQIEMLWISMSEQEEHPEWPSAPPAVPATSPTTVQSGVVISPVVQHALGGGSRRGSAPGSRRGSQGSYQGGTAVSPGLYGGLPPVEPTLNPRRGSATGSFGLPVPPDWLRAQAEGARRGSTFRQAFPLAKDNNPAGDRDSPVQPAGGWIGTAMQSAMAANVPRAPPGDKKRQTLPREGQGEFRTIASQQVSVFSPKQSLKSYISKLFSCALFLTALKLHESPNVWWPWRRCKTGSNTRIFAAFYANISGLWRKPFSWKNVGNGWARNILVLNSVRKKQFFVSFSLSFYLVFYDSDLNNEKVLAHDSRGRFNEPRERVHPLNWLSKGTEYFHV